MKCSLTLPTEAQTLDADERLEVLKKVGLGTSMTDLAVITGGEMAYTREDGVKVIPIGCLR